MKTTYSKWLEDGYSPIGGGALESNINGLWFAQQTEGKGKFVTFTTGTKRGRWVGGDLQVNRADGEEAFSDQTLFADHVDFANTLVGSGAPVLQGQSGIVAYLCWLAMGQETVTGGVNAVMALKGSAELTSGEFRLQLTIGTNVYKTAKLKSTVTATEIIAAMEAAFPGQWVAANIKAAVGGSTVTKSNATPIEFTFENGLGHQPVPNLVVVESTLVGGTLAVEEKTKGTSYKHVATPSNNGGSYFGIFKSVGKTTVHRSQFNDCRATSLRLEGSSASKVVKATPTIISLNPGEVQTTDPSAVDEGLRPWIYTEAQGTFEIDGSIYRGQSAFAVLFTWGLNEYYGDAVHPFDVINNTATASIEGLTIIIDQAGLERFNSQIYGTVAPAAKAVPIEGIPLNGSYKCVFSRTNLNTGGASEKLTIEFTGVKWSPTLAIPANPAGGAVELSFTGMMRKQVGGAYAHTTGEPPFRVTTEYPIDPAFTS
jgi:hypothetical protein